ncbi:MAG: hypothetical protein LT106_05600, partial [Burkholderiaceae bacterium]|nr:hypothetical protein [Burkholderiaceae bacterium]
MRLRDAAEARCKRPAEAPCEMQWDGRPHPTASMCQSGSVTNHSQTGASTMQITTVGIDLAKNVFQVHG